MTEGHGRMRRERDGWGVRFERRYQASPDGLWAAWTEPSRLSEWMSAPVAVSEPRVGGRVAIDFDDGRVDWTVLLFDAPALLEYEWRLSAESPSVIRIELRPEGDGTALMLDHRGLPARQGAGYSAGWHAHLERLAAIVSGGPDASWDVTFEAVLGDYQRQARDLEATGVDSSAS